MRRDRFEVVIIGAGVTGAALAYVLARYAEVDSIAVVEKAARVAALNSDVSQNSQTLHCGDIETNYSLDKAAEVKRAADMVRRYVAGVGERGILHGMTKMVLAVGEAEVEVLRARHPALRELFPDMRLLDAAAVAAWEPEVGRPGGRLRAEPMCALARPETPCAADFGALARSLLRQARAVRERLVLWLDRRVLAVERAATGYRLRLADAEIDADCVAVCAGAHSLGLAQGMGLGRDLAILPVAGSFFHAPLRVRGKVYTVQDPALPFAAVHADPDIACPGRMRLGPTALVIPFLERRNWLSVPAYLRTLRPAGAVLAAFAGLLGVRHLRRYAARNLLYELPGLGSVLFLQQARKLLPGLRLTELSHARGLGGVRPQLVDLKTRRLVLGEARIDAGGGLVFNITPSPGASSCLANAVADAERLLAHLGRGLRREALAHDLLEPA